MGAGVNFGPWLPDMPHYGHEGLVTARNVFPSPLGYEPVKQYSAVTTALPTTWKGGRTFVGIDGTVVMLAGLDGGLYSYGGSVWTNEVAGAYTNKWQFAQFGDLVISVQGAAPLKYTIASGLGATLGGSPPHGQYVTTVKDFVVLSGIGSANSTVAWSAINNAEGWTAGTNQSDTQVLPDGGEVTGLAGGEYLLVFQRDQIWRGQYVGPPLIFQFDKIAQGVGCIAPNSIAQAGRTVFFQSSRGFASITDGTLELIGANQVDTTFFKQYSQADIETSISAAVDPIRKLVIWAMPRRLWVYNFELKRWADIEVNAFAVSTGATLSYSIEGIDTLFPGGLDTVTSSLDDPIYQGGDPFLSIIADDGTVGAFGASTNLQATLTMPRLEPAKGRELRVRAARLDTDAVSGVTLAIDGRARLGDAPVAYTGTAIRTNGDMPIRASGRYVQPSVVFAENTDWTYAQGLELIAAAGGRQ